MKIIDHGFVFAGEKDTDHQSCAFPGICVLPSGQWIGSCRAAPTKKGTVGQHPLLSVSNDRGKTWSRPFNPFTPPVVDDKPGLFRSVRLTPLGGRAVLAAIAWIDHSDPSLPFFNEQTQGLLDTRIFFLRSDDDGLTWSKPERLDTSPFDAPTPLTGPVLVLPNGDLACQFELNKHYDDTAAWRHLPVMMFSKDNGRTWPEHAIVTGDPENRIFYWDQRPAVLKDGRILNLFWTYDNQTAAYLNIHAAESLDHGRTWSQPWDTGVPGQPAAPLSLPDGSIAMVYVDRTAVPGIKLRLSTDNGRSWPDTSGSILYQAQATPRAKGTESMQDAWEEMSKFSIGLPATALLPNGDILVLYYAGPSPDLTDIRWVRVRGKQ